MRCAILCTILSCSTALRQFAPTALTRRAALLQPAAAVAALALPRRALAADTLATATFSAGDPRFLQPVFDDIKYAGVKKAEVGTLDAVPSIQVTYDASRVSYQRVVGVFWRACDPTSVDQFGDPGPTIIWVEGEEQRRLAEESRRRLQRSTEYSSATFGPMFQGRPILTEIRAMKGEWEAAPPEQQEYYKADPKGYEKLRKKTGRTKWFEDAFKPVTVTACQKKDGEGAVCGFVYFPCSEENGCKDVTSGTF